MGGACRTRPFEMLAKPRVVKNKEIATDDVSEAAVATVDDREGGPVAEGGSGVLDARYEGPDVMLSESLPLSAAVLALSGAEPIVLPHS